MTTKTTTRTISVVAMLALACVAGCKKEEVDKAKEVPPASGGTVPTTAPTAPMGKTGAAECDAYLATFEKLAACDKLSPEQKAEWQQRLDLAKNGMVGLDSPSAPAAAKAAAAKGCKDGEDLLKANAPAGCSL